MESTYMADGPLFAEPTITRTPPWERNGQPFDPARAWELICDLRDEIARLRAQRDEWAANAALLTAVSD